MLLRGNLPMAAVVPFPFLPLFPLFLASSELFSSQSCAMLRHSVVSDSLKPHELQPTRLLCPWRFSKQEYQSGLPCPPPGDLPNLGIEPRSPAVQLDSLPSEPQGSPEILQWVAYPFSRGSFQPKNRIGVSCIAGRFFTS